MESIPSKGVRERWDSVAENKGEPLRRESKRKEAQDRVPVLLKDLAGLYTECKHYYSNCTRNPTMNFGKVSVLVQLQL